MADSKTYDRRINIWINGKEVTNDISSIKKEMFNLINAQSRMTIGSKEYIATGTEIRKLKGIIGEHNESLRQSQGLWTKLKDVVSGSLLKISALAGMIYGALQTAKSIINTTEGTADKFNALAAGAKEMFWELQHSVATLSFRNLVDGLSDAFKRGKQLNEELDRLADERAYSDYIISNLSRESRALQEVTKNVELDIKVRAAAAKKREDLENRIYERSVKLAKRVFAIEKDAWEGRNKMGAEEAVKLYEKFDTMNELTVSGLEERAKRGKEFIKDDIAFASWMQQYGTQHGISEETINSYIKFFNLLENGEAEVLPKLFGAFKNFENQVEDAQQRANTFIRESSPLFNKEGKANISVSGDTRGLENAIAGVFQTELAYNPDTYVQDEEKNRLALEKELNAQRVIDNQETQDKINKILVDGANKGLEDFKKSQADEKKSLEARVVAYIDFGARIGEELGRAMAEGNMTAKEAAKQLLIVALDELGNFAQIAITKATIESLTQADSIATFGATGAVRAAIMVGLIKTAVGVAKGIISKNLWDGGYSGPGGKYEPKGIVHGDEWVANSEMVNSPQYGPIIQALEQHRVNGLPGFANGGGTGMNSSGSGAGSSPSIISRDSRLESAINRLNLILGRLDRNGVNMKFGYQEADNVRKGMDKLTDIESSVSM